MGFRAYVGYSALPPLSLAELIDLFEARKAIESAGARGAAANAPASRTSRGCARSTRTSARATTARIAERARGIRERQPALPRDAHDAARNPELRRAFDSLNYEARIARRTRGRGIPDLS